MGTEKASYDRGGGRPSERQARQGEQEATDPMGGPFHYARRPTRAEMVSGIGNPEQKMKMQKLAEFVALHRERFDTEHNNIFAFFFSKILRRFAFLQIIHDRHLAAGSVADVVGIRCGAISGKLKVSDQAARSIG